MKEPRLRPLAQWLWLPIAVPLGVAIKVTELAEYRNPKLNRFMSNTAAWLLDKVCQDEWRKEDSPQTKR